jgi:hypothetical protein
VNTSLCREVIDRGLSSLAAALNQRPPSEDTVDVWTDLFAGENPQLVAKCFRRLAEEVERFPPPRRMRSLLAEYKPSGNAALTHTEGSDKNGKPCWFWSDAPTVPTYRPTDCEEGRALLAALNELGKQKRLPGTEKVKARRAELQAQKVQILSGRTTREPGDET